LVIKKATISGSFLYPGGVSGTASEALIFLSFYLDKDYLFILYV